MTLNAHSELFALQPFMDAMHDAVAIVAQDGTIVGVNETWRQFSKANGGDDVSCYLGLNYLHVCQRSSNDGDDLATTIERGISGVLKNGKEFLAEYPCHSATEKRWFEVVVRPLELSTDRLAMIAHRNITSRKLAQIEADYAEQNAQNLAAIVTAMPDAVISFDLEGRITNWNAAAQTLYGYERDEVVGQSMEMLYPPNWPKRVKAYIAEIITSELKYFDAARQTKSGGLRTVAITAAPIRSATGEIVGISNVHRDVTQKRNAEQKLRSVLDNLFAFVGILDLDGTLVEANRAPLEAAGLEAKDVLGKKFWDCFWWNFSPDVQQKLHDACAQAQTGQLVRYDTQVQVAGGHLVWIDFQLAPLRNLDGQIVSLVPSGIDISDRVKMVEALELSHDTFKNLVTRSPFGIYTVDADFRLSHVSDGAQPVFANVRPLVGHDFEDALNTIWTEDFAREAVALFRHTLASGEPYHAPSTTERRQDKGEVESYDWMIERILMPDGRFGVVCNFYDLSEREKHEQHVHLLMKEVNHRYKNLLAVVLSMARQTARSSSSEEFVDRFSQRLLGLSASQNLIVDGNWGGVSAEELASSQLNHLGEEMQTDRIRIEGPEIIISPPAAEGIGMALHELSTNALKYGSLSGHTGSVELKWSIDQGNRTFQIQWSEQDGPPVSPPERTGFGRTVIEKMAANSVGGSVEVQYQSTGLIWTLTAPIESVEMASDS